MSGFADPAPFPAPEAAWVALLARWTDFARATAALPDDGEGGRWKSSTPAIIGLQAVVFALADLAGRPADHRAFGVDRSRVLIRRYTEDLQRVWGEGLPAELEALRDDAEAAARAATERG